MRAARSARVASSELGGGTIGGGIVEPQKPRLRYANLTAYSPYGLPLADWQGEERYLYSGKELDRTGGLMLYDFHARQYDPQLGRFTSQDPLQGKYPSLNSYLYCAANPISLTDPTGMTIKISGNKIDLYYKDNKLYYDSEYKNVCEDYDDKFVKEVVNAMGMIMESQTGAEMITELTESDNEFTIKKSTNRKDNDQSAFYPSNFAKSYGMNDEAMNAMGDLRVEGGSGGTIYWNPKERILGIDERGSTYGDAFIALAHEFGHAIDSNRGTSFPRNALRGNDSYDPNYRGLPKSEWRAVYRENMVRSELGIPLRLYYSITRLRPHPISNDQPMITRDRKPIFYPR